ncbi:PREDICTED: WAP four-disulfide core domain protein 2 [Chrysochloris asiatica]|uniref:WAP four-disulfide core domain protein 2 n=1 Tax=Chrysochloris asiatica TaxID=185453 RepID=A0A9B0WIU7_CHRAS|nr:PREDICTED: WAP four-disulfide core domain protein 2 [Chrysochloris asiatica]
MLARFLGPLAAALLLGLLLLDLPPGHGDAGEWAGERRTLPATAYPFPRCTRQKAGVCPKLAIDQNCTEECFSDGDCANYLKCCRTGCSALCVLPDEKPGSCPRLDTGILPLGICQDQCQVDSDCPDQRKCCRNGCGNVSCVTPNF